MLHRATTRPRRRAALALLLAAVAAAGTLAVPTGALAAGSASTAPAAATGSSAREAAFAALTRRAGEHGRVRVMVTLAAAPTSVGRLSASREHLVQVADRGRAAVLEELGTTAVETAAPGAPVMSVSASAADLAALRARPEVVTVTEDRVLTSTGTTSFGAASGVQLPKWWHQKRIGLDWTYANGYNGLGRPVVVVDSGVDSTHPWLRGRVVAEACFSATRCPNGATYQYGAGAGRPCTYSYGCAHGTHVAHIAAGQYGAARSAGIVAINASSRGVDKSGRPAPTFYDTDLINALWYAYTSVSPAPASVNLSLGSDLVYAGTCDAQNSTLASWITALRQRGTATVFAAGNGNSAAGISYPACMSSAVAVGNSTLSAPNGVDAVLGGVYGGSNSHGLVDLWAPGTDICSAVPTFLDNDGVADGSDCSYYGTSMAAPQVAGAFAVMASARPTYTVTQALGALQRNGVAVTDSRNGVTRSRISLSNAVYRG